MTKRKISSAVKALAFTAVLAVAGCVGYEYAGYGPPADEVEVYGVAPGPGYVWIGGHHAWHAGAYHWERGRWARAPHAGARWERGTWQHEKRGWRWKEGRWR